MGKIAVLGEVVVDRIITDTAKKDIAGGSAANCALALMRKGDDVQFRARFSTDKDGDFLYQEAIRNQLDVTYSVRTDRPATLVEVRLSATGSPNYQFHLSGTADWHWTDAELAELDLGSQDAVIYGSLAAILEPNFSRIQEWLRSHNNSNLLVGYDPNARPSAIDQRDHDVIRDRIIQLVRSADVVKVSDEDLAWISPEVDPESMASYWSTTGPQLVILTRGENGASAYRQGNCLAHASGVKTKVADTVGAGDTLMAWLVSGLIDSALICRFDADNVIRILDQAVKAAAITCSRVGCDPPNYAEVN